MFLLRIEACIEKLAINVVKVKVTRRPAICDEKSDNLRENRDKVDEWEGDKNDKRSVIARPYARVEPGAVVIVSLHALFAHIAVIAARQSNDLALIAEFIDFKSL